MFYVQWKFQYFFRNYNRVIELILSVTEFHKMEIFLRWVDRSTFWYDTNGSIEKCYIWKLFSFEQAFKVSNQLLADKVPSTSKPKSTVSYGISPFFNNRDLFSTKSNRVKSKHIFVISMKFCIEWIIFQQDSVKTNFNVFFRQKFSKKIKVVLLNM